MRIAVKDANVFIDMEIMGVFDLWIQLGFETLTSTLIELELKRGGHREALAYIRTNHITVINPDLEEVISLHGLHSGISIEDASVLCVAMNRKAMLLTGDRALRLVAEGMHVECHGSIWVLDQLVCSGILPGKVAAEKLRTLVSSTTANIRFLPKKLVQQYIRKWSEY